MLWLQGRCDIQFTLDWEYLRTDAAIEETLAQHQGLDGVGGGSDGSVI